MFLVIAVVGALAGSAFLLIILKSAFDRRNDEELLYLLHVRVAQARTLKERHTTQSTQLVAQAREMLLRADSFRAQHRKWQMHKAIKRGNEAILAALDLLDGGMPPEESEY